MTTPRTPFGPGGSHPEEALAAFTDGTATADERALVLQHIQDCAECRREVELARGALAALSTLPEPASPGLDPEDIVRRAGNVTEVDPLRRRAGRRRRAGAIAAALVAAGILATTFAGVVELNQGGPATSAGGVPGAATGGGSKPAPEVGPSDSSFPALAIATDYTPGSIDRLAAEEAARAGSGGQFAAPGRHVTADARLSATSCADQAAGGGSVDRVLVASFQGRPAFVTILRQDVGGAPAVRVVVTDRSNCDVLYEASHPIGG